MKNLRTTFRTISGEVKAVRGTSFYVNEGESIGIVGESGCGKSVSMLSVLHLLDDNAKMEADEIMFHGKDISKISTREMRKLNGHEIGMIFQDPMTSLNPVFTIEQQIRDPLMRHLGYTKEQARERALEMLRGSRYSEPGEPTEAIPTRAVRRTSPESDDCDCHVLQSPPADSGRAYNGAGCDGTGTDSGSDA